MYLQLVSFMISQFKFMYSQLYKNEQLLETFQKNCRLHIFIVLRNLPYWTVNDRELLLAVLLLPTGETLLHHWTCLQKIFDGFQNNLEFLQFVPSFSA